MNNIINGTFIYHKTYHEKYQRHIDISLLTRIPKINMEYKAVLSYNTYSHIAAIKNLQEKIDRLTIERTRALITNEVDEKIAEAYESMREERVRIRKIVSEYPDFVFSAIALSHKYTGEGQTKLTLEITHDIIPELNRMLTNMGSYCISLVADESEDDAILAGNASIEELLSKFTFEPTTTNAKFNKRR